MTCTHPETGNLLTLYEFDELSESDKLKFEEHLLTCDDCFQNMYSLSPAVARLHEEPKKFLSELKKKEPVRVTWKHNIVDAARNLVEMPLPFRVAIPSVLVTAIVLLLFLLPTRQLSDLARIEPLPYRPLSIKSGAGVDEAKRIFDEGMNYYVQKEYQEAISKLTEALQKHPGSSTFHFYLGLCYLLTEQVNPAIQHLQKSLELSDASNPELACWYLGNAWLLKEKSSDALESFEKVVAFKGDYEWEARDIIEEIHELSKE